MYSVIWLIKITEDSSVSANKTFLYLVPEERCLMLLFVYSFSLHFLYFFHTYFDTAPSPRQRCRIRTNPWLTVADGDSTTTMSVAPKIMDCETGSTSSGVKSNSDVGTDEKTWLPNGYLLYNYTTSLR